MINGNLWDESQEGEKGSVGKLLQHSRYGVVRAGMEVVAVRIKDTEDI